MELLKAWVRKTCRLWWSVAAVNFWRKPSRMKSPEINAIRPLYSVDWICTSGNLQPRWLRDDVDIVEGAHRITLGRHSR